MSGTDTSHMPWWVRAITFFGVPSAIAIFLVWTMAVSQSQALSKVADKLADYNNTTTAAAFNVKEALQESNRRMENYLFIMCVNAGNTSEARNACRSVR